MGEHGPHLLPKRPLGLVFLPNGAKQRTTHLLNLINQKSQHHQHHQNLTEVLLAQAVIMFEVIPLVFQGVEGLVLNFPTSPGATHEVVNIVLG